MLGWRLRRLQRVALRVIERRGNAAHGNDRAQVHIWRANHNSRSFPEQAARRVRQLRQRRTHNQGHRRAVNLARDTKHVQLLDTRRVGTLGSPHPHVDIFVVLGVEPELLRIGAVVGVDLDVRPASPRHAVLDVEREPLVRDD